MCFAFKNTEILCTVRILQYSFLGGQLLHTKAKVCLPTLKKTLWRRIKQRRKTTERKACLMPCEALPSSPCRVTGCLHHCAQHLLFCLKQCEFLAGTEPHLAGQWDRGLTLNPFTNITKESLQMGGSVGFSFFFV